MRPTSQQHSSVAIAGAVTLILLSCTCSPRHATEQHDTGADGGDPPADVTVDSGEPDVQDAGRDDAEPPPPPWWADIVNRCAPEDAETPPEAYRESELPADLGAVPRVAWRQPLPCPGQLEPVARGYVAAARFVIDGLERDTVVVTYNGPPDWTIAYTTRGIAILDAADGTPLRCFPAPLQGGNGTSLVTVSAWNRFYFGMVTERGESAEITGRAMEAAIWSADADTGEGFVLRLAGEDHQPELTIGPGRQLIASIRHRLLSVDALSGEVFWTIGPEELGYTLGGPTPAPDGELWAFRGEWWQGARTQPGLMTIDACGVPRERLSGGIADPLTIDENTVVYDAIARATVTYLGQERVYTEPGCHLPKLMEDGRLVCKGRIQDGREWGIVAFAPDGSRRQEFAFRDLQLEGYELASFGPGIVGRGDLLATGSTYRPRCVEGDCLAGRHRYFLHFRDIGGLRMCVVGWPGAGNATAPSTRTTGTFDCAPARESRRPSSPASCRWGW